MKRIARKRASAARPSRGGRRLATALRALSDGTRLRILRRIAAGPGPVCVCELTGNSPVRQPTVSHHLRVLREAGLATVVRRGTWSYWSPSPVGLAEVIRELRELERRSRVRRRPLEACP